MPNDLDNAGATPITSPALPYLWMENQLPESAYPRFWDAPEGGITAWYTMRLTEIGTDKETHGVSELGQTICDYEARDNTRAEIWLRHFNSCAV